MTRNIISLFIVLKFALLNTVLATSHGFTSKNDLEILKFVRDVSLNKTFVGLVVAHNIGGKKTLARVSQGNVNGLIQKKREILEKRIEYIHSGYEIREYFSDQKVIKIYNNAAPVFPNFLLNDLNEILKYYTLERYGPAKVKVANRDTFVFELKSKDKFRWGVRFWLDSESGLLLKLEYLNKVSNILKKEFFAEISIEPSITPNLHHSSPESKKWRKIYISTFADDNGGLVYNKSNVNGFTFLKCLDSKVYNTNQIHNSEFVHHQCLFSDGVAIVSAVVQNKVRPIKMFQRSNGCMSEKVGLKGDKPIYVGGCVPGKTIQYFFNKLSKD